MGLCLPAVVIAPKVGWQPAGFAPLLELRRHPRKLRIFPQIGVPEAELALCRKRWQGLKRTIRRNVVQHCDGFKDKDRRALRYLLSLEDKGLLESKANNSDTGTEITFKPTE